MFLDLRTLSSQIRDSGRDAIGFLVTQLGRITNLEPIGKLSSHDRQQRKFINQLGYSGATQAGRSIRLTESYCVTRGRNIAARLVTKLAFAGDFNCEAQGP